MATHDAVPDTQLRLHGVYLITGGMGALGQIFARHLCATYQATVYLTDLANFACLNDIYASYFGSWKPARTTVGVAQLPKGGLVEIDLIAIV